MRDQPVLHFLERFGLMAPLLIAAIFGIVWTIVNWKKASTPALIGVITFAILLLLSCCFPATEIWMPRLVLQYAPPRIIQNFEWLFRGLRFSESLCWGLSVVALVVAAFLGRSAMEAKKDKKNRDRIDDEDESLSEKPLKKKRPRDDED